MQSVTCALVPSVPEEGSRQRAIRLAGKQESQISSKSGTRGGGSWDRKAKGRLPNSAFPHFRGGADDLPQVRTARRAETPRQDPSLPQVRPSPDLPVSDCGAPRMTQHNIIGSEPSGPHVVVRTYRRRGWPWWVQTIVQLAAVSLPVAFLVALVRIAGAMG